jgi:EcsC protein family
MTQSRAMIVSEVQYDIAALAARYRRANGPLMGLMNRIGGGVEAQMKSLPAPVRDQIGRATEGALQVAFGLAAQGARAPDIGPQGPMIAVMATGAAGGFGGLPTAIAELPVTVTVILHAIRAAAAEAGYDPDDPAIRAECLQIFGAGSPLEGDDGVNAGLVSARLAVSGSTVAQILATVAPRLATALGQKVIAQAVPVIGAVTGAALNAAYMRYYREIARIRFALLRLGETHGTEAVLAEFKALSVLKVTKA